jgi:oxygen-independent coproporphyrinogen III oxidase
MDLPYNALIKKYDVPIPRYTSYPTVPCWDTNNFSNSKWQRAVERVFDESNETKGISLYIHLPFCESLCTYCACNKRITKNHAVEDTYSKAILAEWELYRYIFGRRPIVRELHLGGGTPTFFKPENLKKLLQGILSNAIIHPQRELSFEGHPNNTTAEHLQVLYDIGFRRVSYGVQDLDPKVQEAIHRIQPFENLESIVAASRSIGYESISFDLIYGLPYQTIETISATFKKVIQLRPDRIAFYSYAHVPWVIPGQRGYEDADLPSDIGKRLLYEAGCRFLKQEGYHNIGMDHFALPHDTLYNAMRTGRLHRNFMGYTTSNTDLLIGLGTSAISDAKYAYAQNLKQVENYEHCIKNNELAIFKGHVQTEEDTLLKACIINLACNGELKMECLQQVQDEQLLIELQVMQSEGILVLTLDGISITDTGKAFIRNICNVFDRRMKSPRGNASQIFSKAI